MLILGYALGSTHRVGLATVAGVQVGLQGLRGHTLRLDGVTSIDRMCRHLEGQTAGCRKGGAGVSI